MITIGLLAVASTIHLGKLGPYKSNSNNNVVRENPMGFFHLFRVS